MKTDLVIQALRSAVTRRKPAKGLIHHGDKGSQYTSYESFWTTLKKELVYQCHFKTRDEARPAIFEYIEVYYNRERLHSSLLYQTPQGFELAQQAQQAQHDQVLIQKAA